MAPHTVVIDSGFSTQLAHYVKEPIDNHPLWTARFLLSDKEGCIQTHKDFIKAGAQIIRTNTYQTSKEGLTKHLNITEDEAKALVTDSIEFCHKAIAQEKHPENVKVKIGGSVGPYGACLADGSEYTGSYCNSLTEEKFIEWHRWRITALIEAGVDLLTVETIPCSKEGIAVLRLLKEFPSQKAWLSFSLKSGTEISNGENFAEVAEKCWELGKDQLVAIGVNCCNPEYVSSIFDSLKNKNSSIPFIAYPNSGEIYDGMKKIWIEGSNKRKISEFVSEWLDKGISYVGGCCRNPASELANIALAVKSWENKT